MTRPCKRVYQHHKRLAYIAANADCLGVYYDPEDGDKCIRFMEKNLLVKVEGELIPCQVEPWMADDIIRPMLGWKHKGSGYPLFRKVFIQVGKKNWKTGLAAGVALFKALFGGQGREIYCSSVLIKNARRSFEDMADYIATSPQLKSFFRLNGKNPKSATVIHSNVGEVGNDIMLLSRDNSQDGMRPYFAVIDEIHAAKAQSQRDTIDTLINSASSIKTSQIMMITTAGLSLDCLGHEQYEYGCAVLDGVFEDHEYFAYITEPDEGVEWDSDTAIEQANPNLGVSVHLDDVKRDRGQASMAGGFALAKFKAQKLDMWSQGGSGTAKWIDMALWKACGLHYTPDELSGRPCYLGIDLSKTTDLTCIVALFPGIPVKTLCWSFMPRREMEVRREAPFPLWADQGWLTPCETYNIDHELIFKTIKQIGDKFQIKQIGYDRNLSGHLENLMLDADLDIVPVNQSNFVFSEPSKRFEIMIGGGKIAHNFNPCFSWQVANAEISDREGALIKPRKTYTSAKGRVDAVISAIMALYVMEKSERTERPVDFDQLKKLAQLRAAF